MKPFAVLIALVAAVSAEADPGLLLPGLSGLGLGLGLPYGRVGVPAAIPAIPGGYASAGRYLADSAGVIHRARRDADPGLLLPGLSGLGLGLGLGLPYGRVGVPAAIPAIPGGYAAAGRYLADSAGVIHRARRDAEADPSLLSTGLGYGLPIATGYLGYNAAGLPALKAAPCVNVAGVPQKCADVNVLSYGAPYGGVRVIGKRDADAEADPSLLSTGLGYGLPIATGYLGYNAAGLPALKAAPCVNAAGVPQKCAKVNVLSYGATISPYGGARVIGKRDADAEADPGLLLPGLSGLGLGLGLPYGRIGVPAAIPAIPGGYASAGRYLANSAGIIHAA